MKRICGVGRMVLSGSLVGPLEAVSKYVRYKLKDQYELVYFEVPIGELSFTLNMCEPLTVRPAVRGDISRLESDIYPLLKGYGESDKHYISQIGKEGVTCFVGEKDGKLVHYFLVHEKALESPLAKTPFDKRKVGERDAYLGSAFTSPHVRGAWIFPYSLSRVCEYLKNDRGIARAIILVHKDTPGAVRFYKRLGFKEIADACPAGPLAVVKKIARMMNPR